MLDLNSEKFELDHQFIGHGLIESVHAGRGKMEGRFFCSPWLASASSLVAYGFGCEIKTQAGGLPSPACSHLRIGAVPGTRVVFSNNRLAFPHAFGLARSRIKANSSAMSS
jgi:hypothetical protein